MTPHEHRNRTQPSEIDKELLDIGICDKPDEVKARYQSGWPYYKISRLSRCLLPDVTPDFHKSDRRLWSKNTAHAHLGLVFQFRQMSIQLIWISFATVE